MHMKQVHFAGFASFESDGAFEIQAERKAALALAAQHHFPQYVIGGVRQGHRLRRLVGFVDLLYLRIDEANLARDFLWHREHKTIGGGIGHIKGEGPGVAGRLLLHLDEREHLHADLRTAAFQTQGGGLGGVAIAEGQLGGVGLALQLHGAHIFLLEVADVLCVGFQAGMNRGTDEGFMPGDILQREHGQHDVRRGLRAGLPGREGELELTGGLFRQFDDHIGAFQVPGFDLALHIRDGPAGGRGEARLEDAHAAHGVAELGAQGRGLAAHVEFRQAGGLDLRLGLGDVEGELVGLTQNAEGADLRAAVSCERARGGGERLGRDVELRLRADHHLAIRLSGSDDFDVRDADLSRKLGHRAFELELERVVIAQRLLWQHDERFAARLASHGFDLPLLDACACDAEDFLIGRQADFRFVDRRTQHAQGDVRRGRHGADADLGGQFVLCQHQRAHLRDGLRGTPGDVLLYTGTEEAGELCLPAFHLGGEGGSRIEFKFQTFSRHRDAES